MAKVRVWYCGGWPLEGEPADVVGRIEAYGKWLAARDDVPKLLVAFEPSSRTMIGADLVEWCRSNIAGLEVENGRRAYHLALRINRRPSPPRSRAAKHARSR